MSAGIKIWRELDSLELKIEDLGKCFNRQGFGEPGHAFEQTVAACKECHQHLIDNFFLTDNYFFELFRDEVSGIHQFFNRLNFFCRWHNIYDSLIVFNLDESVFF